MTAEALASSLDGRRVGAGWLARCPAHDDRNPSLSISASSDGRVLLYCHTGCSQERVIWALKELGLWPAYISCAPSDTPGMRPNRDTSSRERLDAERTQWAIQIWKATRSASGTLVGTYLNSRGLRIAPPPSLRFHVALKHPSGRAWPAMGALVARGDDNEPIGIHRTFLTPDGGGKAPIEPTRMMLGPCRGGAVRLAPPVESLMVGEGIETCLAAMQSTGMPAWAALSTSGLRTLILPERVTSVIVLADGDDPGEAAACDCALRWKGEGRHVRIARPQAGSDFNDLLLKRSFRIEGGSV